MLTLRLDVQAMMLVAGVRGWIADQENKKRPKLFSLGRLGSPPPELPNHDWIVSEHRKTVNITEVIGRGEGRVIKPGHVSNTATALRQP